MLFGSHHRGNSFSSLNVEIQGGSRSLLVSQQGQGLWLPRIITRDDKLWSSTVKVGLIVILQLKVSEAKTRDHNSVGFSGVVFITCLLQIQVSGLEQIVRLLVLLYRQLVKQRYRPPFSGGIQNTQEHVHICTDFPMMFGECSPEIPSWRISRQVPGFIFIPDSRTVILTLP